MSKRTCGWCDAPIEHMRANAKYCCKQHQKNAGSKRHRERNPGYYKRYAHSERFQEWRRVNADEIRRRSRDARRVNGPNPGAAAWRAANKDRLRVNQRNRVARLRANPQSVGVSIEDWQALVRRYRGCCAYCTTPAVGIQMDHVVPISRGGRHAIGNVLPACRWCNQSKGARLLVEWRHEHLVASQEATPEAG